MEAIAAVASLASVIDIAVRCISSLTAIRRRYKSVATDIELLQGYIITVRMVLEQISSLIEGRMNEEQHHQLIIDLSIATKCCKLMLTELEQQFHTLGTGEDGSPWLESRVKFALGHQPIMDCIQRLGSLISALHCIVSVFHVNLEDQKDILERDKVKRVFKEIQDDSTSLVVLFDSASLASRRTTTTTGTSKLSLGFGFDNELLQHRIYKGTFRSLIRRAKARTFLTPDSKEIRVQREGLEANSIGIAQNVTISQDTEEHQSVPHTTEVIHGGRPEPPFVIAVLGHHSQVVSDALACRLWIYRSLAKLCLHATEVTRTLLDFEALILERHRTSLRLALERNHFQRNAKKAIQWFALHVELFSFFITRQTMKDMERILRNDYLPTREDVRTIPDREIEKLAERFPYETMRGSIFAVPNSNLSPGYFNVLNIFNVSTLLFTFDLPSYNKGYFPSSDPKGLSTALSSFEWLLTEVKGISYGNIVIILANFGEYQEKLSTKLYAKSKIRDSDLSTRDDIADLFTKRTRTGDVVHIVTVEMSLSQLLNLPNTLSAFVQEGIDRMNA